MSTQDVSGDMGVSSGIEGPTGPGQHGTDGVRDVSEPEVVETVEGDDLAEAEEVEARPEQSVGGVEVHPDPPIPPKSGYNSRDPRSGS